MNGTNGFVVDASVALKWHLSDENLVREAADLLTGHKEQRLILMAPSFIRYELANSLDQARRRNRINGDQAVAELRAFLRFGVHADVDADDLLVAAREVAERAGTSVYDATYLAFSAQVGLPFLTEDRSLLARALEQDFRAYHLSEVATLL